MEKEQQLVSYANKSLEEVLEDAKMLVKSGLCPFKKPEDAMLVLQAGKELGIGYTQAITNLYPVNGRVTMGVHLREALVQGNDDIVYRVIEDYVLLYHFRAKGGYNLELTSEELKKGILDGTFQIITTTTPAEQYVESKVQILKLTPPFMAEGLEDRRTTIEFEVVSKGVKERVSYHLHEAYQAGLVSARPDTWGKYTNAMVYKSCFNRGSDRYCSHILKGIKETGEMLDTTKVKYQVNQQGHVTNIDGDDLDYEEVDQVLDDDLSQEEVPTE